MMKYKKFILCLAVLLIVLSMGTVSAHMSEYPAVNIETPIHNTEVSGEVEIVATVDDHYTTEHVNFTIEGLDDSNKEYKSNYQDTNPDDGWKYTWDTTKVVDGRYYLQARAMNNLSLKGEYNILLHVVNSKDTNNTPLPTNASGGEQTLTNTTISENSFNFTQIYGTYLGGNGEDKAKGVFTDADGNIYIAMETNSNDLNTTDGVYQANKSGGKDLYVAKFDKSGEIIFATFIGGSSTEFEKDFKIDNEGNIYITGLTASKDFPVTDNALIKNLTGAQSAYLTVLSADGKKLKYSTYLGGSKVDRGWALFVDDEGNAFIQGITNSIDFPVTDDAYQSDKDGVDWDSNTSSDDIDFQNSFDIFISKLNTNSGELIYSTYFGGRGADSTYGSLAVKDDIVYFAGTTTSIDFHTTANANRTVRNVGEADSFLAAINITSGELLYSSYIGGSKTDDGEALFISDDGFLYYLGDTWSDDFPTTPNAYQKTYGGVGDGISGGDIFAMKFDTSNWSIVYSTYLGGNADEGGRAIAVDDEGNLFIGGMSQSSDFPVTDDAFQKVKNGQVYVADPQQHADFYTMDAVLAVLSADGSELLYSTYIGGDYGEFIMGVELIDGGVILQFRT
uniref:SBBP repeat-containing protein n=1 Tax=Methanobrevibacter sp. TaxID=66852 RepID=UPI0038904204